MQSSSAIIYSNQARKTNNAASVEKNVLTSTRSLVEEILSEKTELQSKEVTPTSKIETMCEGDTPSLRQTETSPERKGGEGRERGWCNVKVSQDHMTSMS